MATSMVRIRANQIRLDELDKLYITRAEYRVGESIVNVNILPAASPTLRGKIFCLMDAENQEDTLYFCRKRVDGTYEWTSLDAERNSIIQQCGNAAFSSNGTVITLDFIISSDYPEYFVEIIPIENPGGNLGEVWIEKYNDKVIIHNSGEATTKFRYKLLYGLEASIQQDGLYNFSPDGTKILIANPPEVPLNYVVEISLDEDTAYDVGEVWVEKFSDSIIVHNSGNATTKFKCRIMSTDDGLSHQSGEAYFDETGVAIDLNVFGLSDYFVEVTPVENPSADIGEVWIERYINQVIIKNSGNAKTKFLYRITSGDSFAKIDNSLTNGNTQTQTQIDNNFCDSVLSLPNPDISQRGRIVILYGLDRDSIYICKKIGGNSYSWIEIG